MLGLDLLFVCFLFKVFLKVVILCGCIPKHWASFTLWKVQQMHGMTTLAGARQSSAITNNVIIINIYSTSINKTSEQVITSI